MDTVVFRIFKDGSVLALFPNIPWNTHGECTSYMHVGQHGAADYSHCVKITRPATEQEYAPLKRELEKIGYELDVRKRWKRKFE